MADDREAGRVERVTLLVSEVIPALVRPVVTFIFAAAIVVGFLRNLLNGETFMTAASMVLAFWFGQRSPAPESPRPVPSQAPVAVAVAAPAPPAPRPLGPAA